MPVNAGGAEEKIYNDSTEGEIVQTPTATLAGLRAKPERHGLTASVQSMLQNETSTSLNFASQ